MLSWSRPDPLTRDLIHLINARRHDHGDTDAAIDTLQAFIEQGREQDLLTVLAALDEEMAEWMFDLVAEASCAVIMDGPDDDKGAYALMAALELPLQANLGQPLGLKIDPVATADLLHRHLQIPAGVVVRVEPRLLTDATLEGLTLQTLNEHLVSIADSQRTQAIASRLYPPVENTAFLFFQLIGMPDPGLPDSLEEPERRALLEGLVAQCAELALEIVQCARLVRGYGETWRKSRAAFVKILDELVDNEQAVAKGADALKLAIRSARNAALVYEEAKPAPAVKAKPVIWMKQG